MNLLHKYLNGNVTVSLYEDGTKIQEWDDNETPNPMFPVSMDLKITNKCDLNCKFCHEMSTNEGEHAELIGLYNHVLHNLPPGTELAIGGGNPLSHPQLLVFLQYCKQSGLICNMTVNCKHLNSSSDFINHLIKEKLIWGLGISLDDNFNFETLNKIQKKDNVVFHVIYGVNDISILDKIQKSPVKKVLILGYKTVGRGIDFITTNDLTDKMNYWKNKIGNYIRKIHLSFDNLALKQLPIKDYLTDEEWKQFFMGEDGQFTMYIDAVKNEYAMNSTAKERYPINKNIVDIFAHVKSERNA